MPEPSAQSPQPQDPPQQSSLFENLFRSLRYRNFRLFFIGQGVSLIGTWMQQVAMSWLVYRLTGSARMLGTVIFVGQIPMLLVSPLAGAVAERFNRHTIMLITQTLSMLQAFAVAALVLTGKIAIWQIIPLNLIIGCVNAFDMPARQSYYISMIGRREDLNNAIALNSSIVNGARLIGPTVAGFAIARWGEGICFMLNGVSYWAVLWSLLAMDRVAHARAAQSQSVLENIKEGLVYAFGFPPMRAILLLLALVSLVGVPYSTLMPVIATENLHGGPNTFGWLLGAAGLGAFLGAVQLAARRNVLGLGRVMTLAAGGFGAALVAFSFTHTLWLALPLLVVSGFGMIVTLASANTLLQTLVSDHMRGRIMSLYAMAFMGVVPFGSLAAGWLAQEIGALHTLLIGGLFCLAGAAFFGLRLEAMRDQVRPIYHEKGILPGTRAGEQAEAGQ